jgi:hypothetical protein
MSFNRISLTLAVLVAAGTVVLFVVIAILLTIETL